MLQERRPIGRFFFNMGLPMPVRQHLYIEIGPRDAQNLYTYADTAADLGSVSIIIMMPSNLVLHCLIQSFPLSYHMKGVTPYSRKDV